MPRIDKAKALKMYQAGKRPGEIANHFGTSASAVSQFLTRNGLAPKHRKVKPHYGKATQMYADGFSVTEIAEKLGLAVSTLSNYFSAHGIRWDAQRTIARYRQALQNAVDLLNEHEHMRADIEDCCAKTYTMEEFMPR